jgi:Haem-dependent oxidative N-demethylase, alpha subunit-like
LQNRNGLVTLASEINPGEHPVNLRDLPYTLDDIFPAGDFAFHMRFRRGDIAEFFTNTSSETILNERQRWLDHNAGECAAILPAGEPLLDEVIELATRLGISVPRQSTPTGTCVALGRAWEPDLLFLRTVADSQPELAGGCVCFPSSWSFEEKMGRPLDAIHTPVPTFNAQFASPVKQFLSRMKPGISWERINWGLSRTSELNQHPNRRLPRLDASVELKDVWFRVEYQSLVALPRTNGILFGIRLIIEPLSRLARDPAFASGLSRGLATMPESVATYKGLQPARQRLTDLLRSN